MKDTLGERVIRKDGLVLGLIAAGAVVLAAFFVPAYFAEAADPEPDAHEIVCDVFAGLNQLGASLPSACGGSSSGSTSSTSSSSGSTSSTSASSSGSGSTSSSSGVPIDAHEIVCEVFGGLNDLGVANLPTNCGGSSTSSSGGSTSSSSGGSTSSSTSSGGSTSSSGSTSSGGSTSSSGSGSGSGSSSSGSGSGSSSGGSSSNGSSGGSGSSSGGGGTVVGLISSPTITPTATNQGCDMYLNSFIRFGAANDTQEVIKLQLFLKDLQGFSTLAVTGVYDQATYNAVRTFQTRYASDVLTPWGATAPTGYVYLTTRKKINELYCDNQRQFALTAAQQQEIQNYRTRVATSPVQSVGSQGTSQSQTTDVSEPTTPETPDTPEVPSGEELVGAAEQAVENTRGFFGRLWDRFSSWWRNR